MSSPLIDRYIQEVGQYLAPKERADIELELRSQIHDQLDDRYGLTPSDDEVAAVLAELGHPYQMAASYGGTPYLIGPQFYPFLIRILRLGWLVIAPVFVFVEVFGTIINPASTPMLTVIGNALLSALETGVWFSAVTILIFALVERSGLRVDHKPFDPHTLPEVDDPRRVDRAEAIGGIVMTAIVTLILFHFMRVGGLTLSLNPAPSDVIPVPVPWLVLMLVTSLGLSAINAIVLRRNRWNVLLWVIETMLELVGVVVLYFVLYEPLFRRLAEVSPELRNTPVISDVPEILVVLSAFFTLVSGNNRLLKLINLRRQKHVITAQAHH
jgi:hypothetical protein